MTPLLLVALLALVSQPLTGQGEKIQTDTSSSGQLLAEHFFFGADAPRRIYVRATAGKGQLVLLTEYPRNGTVLFSPDDKWIALNDNLGSDMAEVRLFKRDRGLRFREVLNADISGKAWAFLARTYRRHQPVHLDHMYVNVVHWADDSRALLLLLWGHTDSDNYVEPWYCVYHIPGKRVGISLAPLNRGAVKLSGR